MEVEASVNDQQQERKKIILNQNTENQNQSNNAPQEDEFDEHVKASILNKKMGYYYEKFFPAEEFYEWLSYQSDQGSDKLKLNDSYFQNREFSFTIMKPDEIYCRYQSFQNAQELRQSLMDKKPVKIDIGAVFDQQPSKDKKEILIAKEREFIIDIDMDDYNEVRTCCQDSKICPLCWKLMIAAGKVLNKSLRDDFGFTSVLWVFSGRRGIHLWVCDKKAREMSNKIRSSVVDNLNIISGNEDSGSKLKRGMHYGVFQHAQAKRAYDILANDFVQIILKDQDLLNKKPDIFQKIIDAHHSNLWKEINQEWKDKIKKENRILTSYEKWKILNEQIEILASDKKQKFQKLINLEKEIVLTLLYPRLDVNVSKTINHLLKAPFCIHPKTDKVCVPFTIEHISTFDPFNVPTYESLVEWNDKKQTAGNPMEPYILIFKEFLRKLKNNSVQNNSFAKQILESYSNNF